MPVGGLTFGKSLVRLMLKIAPLMPEVGGERGQALLELTAEVFFFIIYLHTYYKNHRFIITIIITIN